MSISLTWLKPGDSSAPRCFARNDRGEDLFRPAGPPRERRHLRGKTLALEGGASTLPHHGQQDAGAPRGGRNPCHIVIPVMLRRRKPT